MTAREKEIVAQAKLDPKFRMDLLKEIVRLAVKLDPTLLERAVKNIQK